MVCGTEWLEFSDFIEQAVIGRQSYILQGYSPFISVAFHLFCASQSHSKLSYPSSQYEVTEVCITLFMTTIQPSVYMLSHIIKIKKIIKWWTVGRTFLIVVGSVSCEIMRVEGNIPPPPSPCSLFEACIKKET